MARGKLVMGFRQRDEPRRRDVSEHRRDGGPGERVALAHEARADEPDAQ